jgi:hypothetical protein
MIRKLTKFEKTLTDEELLAIVRKLTKRERIRYIQILRSTGTLVEAMTDCSGPHDAKIAMSIALAIVFLSNVGPITYTPSPRVAMEFILEAILAMRNENF